MKNIRIATLVFISTVLLLAGCSSLPKDEEQTWAYSSDKIVGVLPQSDGLHFSKKNLSGYKEVTIHLEKIISIKKDGSLVTDPYILDFKPSSSKSNDVYPFVKAGQQYKIWATYKNPKNGKKISSTSVNVKASGGIGEARVYAKADYKCYDSKNWRLNLSAYENKNPVKNLSGKITGYIDIKDDKSSFFYNDFKIEGKKINLKPVMGKIRNKDFGIRLIYTFEYEGLIYEQDFLDFSGPLFSDNNSTFEVKNTGLPAVYLTTKTKKDVASREKYEDGTIKIENKTYNLQIKGRGNSSWGQFPKHSYTLKLNKSESLLGMKKNKSWVLVSNYGDKTLIRNQYVYYLGKEIFNKMMWNPTFKQVDLYINNDYKGTYLLGEKIAIGKNRVNVNENGFIVEMNRREDEDFNFRTTHDVSISLKEPDKVDKKTQQKIRKIIQDAEDAMFSKNFADPQKGYAAYIDVDSFIDWYLINEFAKNVDSAWFSSIYIVYNPADGKLHLGPLWDYDLGLGNINYNDCDNPEGYYIQKRGVWYAQLFKDPAFRAKVKKRWNEKKNQLKASIETQIDKFYSQVLESSYYNFEKWPILGEYVWPNADGWNERLSIQSEIDYLKEWCHRRFEWMDQAINKY